MTATITFDLPDERDEFETAQDGAKYRAVIADLSTWLREQVKHTERADKHTLQEVRQKLVDMLNEEGLPP